MNKDEQKYLKLSREIASRIESAAFTAHDCPSMQEAIDLEVEKCKPVVREFFVTNGYDLKKMDEFISEAVRTGTPVIPK